MKKNRKIGFAFWEQIEEKRNKSRILYGENWEEQQISDPLGNNRVYAVYFLFLIFVFVLIGKIFDVMILNGAKNKELAEQNRIRLNVIEAPRGVIYDRNKNPLVRNTVAYLKRQKDGTTQIIDRDTALAKIAGNDFESAGIYTKTIREYPYKDVLGHVLGYLTEIEKEEMNSSSGKTDYQPGDKIGRLGIEEQYESVLRGVNGKELIETDALGRTIKKIGEKQPFSGRDVRLTLDLRLQKLVKDAFLDKEKGAVVASDPSTGEILAVYSSPSFDPNLFTMPQTVESSKALKNILESKESPLFNRAIGGVYPSGSTFKIVTAAAGLETGKISAKTEIEDVGEIKIGPYRFPNWYFLQYGGKDGMVNVVRALKRSNDIFFYKAGEMVGLDSLVLMARKFGLSEKTGIDFPHESKGLMPDEEWKKKTIGDNWYLGDTYHLAIGQGYLLVTPLQINLMTNVIANGGKLCRPHLRLNDQSDSNASDVLCWDIGLKTETISLIKEGMKEACLEGGTAWPFFDFKIQSLTSQETEKISVGCKTGTAEFGDPNNNTHGWFTVFAPFEKPKITMTILVEGAGEGSNVAAPVAKKVLSEWLRSN